MFQFIIKNRRHMATWTTLMVSGSWPHSVVTWGLMQIEHIWCKMQMFYRLMVPLQESNHQGTAQEHPFHVFKVPHGKASDLLWNILFNFPPLCFWNCTKTDLSKTNCRGSTSPLGVESRMRLAHREQKYKQTLLIMLHRLCFVILHSCSAYL